MACPPSLIGPHTPPSSPRNGFAVTRDEGGVYTWWARREERLCPPYEFLLERADGEIAQPQIGVAAFFPEPEQRPVQRLPQQVVAFAHRNSNSLAKIPAFDERAAAERAAFARIGAVDPERQRDGVAENEIDLAAPQCLAQRVVVRIGVQFGIGEQRLEIGLMRGAGDGANFLPSRYSGRTSGITASRRDTNRAGAR